METALAQALRLTVAGMGMTFASIGALVLGMLGIGWLTARHTPLYTSSGGSSGKRTVIPDIGGEREGESRRPSDPPPQALAAAATVAVARALDIHKRGAAVAAALAAAHAVAASRALVEPAVADAVDSWNAYVRAQRLAGRMRYDARRRD